MSDPNMFDAREEPLLNEAFATAWRTLTAQKPDLVGSIVLQSTIASALMAAAARGIVDPALLARSAIEHCSSMPNDRFGTAVYPKSDQVVAVN
jgi:hypothetical protein